MAPSTSEAKGQDSDGSHKQRVSEKTARVNRAEVGPQVVRIHVQRHCGISNRSGCCRRNEAHMFKFQSRGLLVTESSHSRGWATAAGVRLRPPSVFQGPWRLRSRLCGEVGPGQAPARCPQAQPCACAKLGRWGQVSVRVGSRFSVTNACMFITTGTYNIISTALNRDGIRHMGHGRRRHPV